MNGLAKAAFEQLINWAPLFFILICCAERKRPASVARLLDILLICALGPVSVLVYNSPGLVKLSNVLLYVVSALLFVRLLLVARNPQAGLSRVRARPWSLAAVLAAALLFNAYQLPRRPRADSGMCACIGAAHIMRTHTLPYGAFSCEDTYGPLLYLMHIPVERAIPLSTNYNWRAAKAPAADSCLPRGESNDTGHLAMAFLFHLLGVAGIVVLGVRERSAAAGLAFACAYALSPAVWANVNQSSQVIPAALCIWALVLVSRPFVAGLLIGLGAAAMFYPAFLIPLWAGWYRKRQGPWLRFVAAVCVVGIASLCLVLLFTNPEPGHTALTTFLRKTVAAQHGGGVFDTSGSQVWSFLPRGLARFSQSALMLAYAAFCIALFGLCKPDARSLAALSGAVCLGITLWKSHLAAGSYTIWYFGFAVTALLWPAPANREPTSRTPRTPSECRPQ